MSPVLPKKARKPTIGITLGDPCGIGPEVIAKALSKSAIRSSASFKIIGDTPVFNRFFKKRYSNVELVDISRLSSDDIRPGQSTPKGAKASLGYIQTAIDLRKSRQIDALVTGPVSKEAISAVCGKKFCGHTEFLADAFGVKDFEMMFVGGGLKTIVVTRHIPLKDVSRHLTKAKILKTLRITHRHLKKFFRIPAPRIAVCGLNPHAGEGGSIGLEEQKTIIPAVKQARRLGIKAEGPFAADTIFEPTIAESFDIIIAMYHDQGLIPVKTLAFSKLVNITIGLPFIRTSPAHGTAFNIAGKNIADPGSMSEAIKLAIQLSGS